MTKRVFLSPPHLTGREIGLITSALESNWIAPLGPMVDAFEKEVCEYVGIKWGAALSSGTAALHLALLVAEVERGHDVLCATMTFSATANAIAYVGGNPVFIDCDRTTWNLDPDLLQEELSARAASGRKTAAVIAVDLYGQCADYGRIEAICRHHGVPLIEDAAEALGATYRGKKAGCFGQTAIFSFNGNKTITTSGGGMLVSDDKALIDRARFLATQARDPAPYYRHSTIGFNYRMSNILAAVGRGQLASVAERVEARRANFLFYQEALKRADGISFMPEASYGRSSRWLTCILVDPREFGATAEDIRLALEAENIESRPLWKPMHTQPVFKNCRKRGGDVAEDLFEKGLCLPSGSSLSDADKSRVIDIIVNARNKIPTPRQSLQDDPAQEASLFSSDGLRTYCRIDAYFVLAKIRRRDPGDLPGQSRVLHRACARYQADLPFY
jgi:dTDP-4-amino-4,6-dideoxygalactose transaminase